MSRCVDTSLLVAAGWKSLSDFGSALVARSKFGCDVGAAIDGLGVEGKRFVSVVDFWVIWGDIDGVGLAFGLSFGAGVGRAFSAVGNALNGVGVAVNLRGTPLAGTPLIGCRLAGHRLSRKVWFRVVAKF
jgi:hypothetical protein